MNRINLSCRMRTAAASKAALTAMAAFLLLLPSCEADRYARFRGYAQGGEYAVTCNLKGVRMRPESIRAGIDSVLREIDFTLSGYNKASVLSRFNSGEDVTLPPMFTDIYDLSYRFNLSSGGAFNVAAGRLFDIWGFGFTSDSLPSKADIDSALSLSGMSPEPRPGVNFNAVAQGYSCDLVASYLHSLGIHDMLVDIGEIYLEGLNPSRRGWTIGIDNPVDGNFSPGADLRGTWTSDGGAYGVVTSGNYRKFYVKDGRKYSHTIDPRTGWPVTHNLLSATIIVAADSLSVAVLSGVSCAAGSCRSLTMPACLPAACADALATICMVIGPEEARTMVESAPGVEACLICDDTLWTSPGFN